MSTRGRAISRAALILAACVALAMTVSGRTAEPASDPFLAGDLPLPQAIAHAQPVSVYEALNLAPVSPRGTRMQSIDPDAWYQTGRDFADGLKGDKDPEEGAYWLKRAFLHALAPRELAGLSRVGYMYALGLGVKQNIDIARVLWELAAASGDDASLYYLGALAERGLGAPPDRDAAIAWYRKAAGLGHKEAQAALKRLGAG